MYSVVQNYQNNQEIHKMGMTIELDTINPALLRYTRIYCYIVEYADAIKEALTGGGEGEEGANPDEATRKTTAEEDAEPEYVLNEFLTGFYVIGGIEYIYRGPGPLRMKLHLLRREFWPSS